MTKNLIVYHTTYGSTGEIARWIGERIGGDTVSVKDSPDPASYDLVIIGTPIYGDKPLKPVQRWVEQNKEMLLEKAVVLFAVALDIDDMYVDGSRIGPVEALMPLIEALEGQVMLAQGLYGELNPGKLSAGHAEELARFYSMMGIGPPGGGVPFRTRMDKSQAWAFAERIMRRYDRRKIPVKAGQSGAED